MDGCGQNACGWGNNMCGNTAGNDLVLGQIVLGQPETSLNPAPKIEFIRNIPKP